MNLDEVHDVMLLCFLNIKPFLRCLGNRVQSCFSAALGNSFRHFLPRYSLWRQRFEGQTEVSYS